MVRYDLKTADQMLKTGRYVYPENLPKLVSSYPKGITQNYLTKTQELIKWIIKDLKSKE